MSFKASLRLESTNADLLRHISRVVEDVDRLAQSTVCAPALSLAPVPLDFIWSPGLTVYLLPCPCRFPSCPFPQSVCSSERRIVRVHDCVEQMLLMSLATQQPTSITSNLLSLWTAISVTITNVSG